MKTKSIFMAVLLVLGVAACQNDESPAPQNERSTMDQRMTRLDVDIQSVENARKAGGIEAWMASVNESLAQHNILLEKIEYYGADGAGNTVFFNNRGNKQLASDFVPGDARRGGFTDIAYARDGIEATTSSGLTKVQTDGAILSAMNSWDNVSCSKGLILTDIGSSPFDLGFVQALIGAGGSFFFTDIMHSGFTSSLFDIVFGPGSNVLGVSFTFIWIDGSGNPTDIDNNGKSDAAFRDIYYNDAFSWAIDGSDFDVETVALHEAGHGLSQGHFGKLFRTDKNGKLHFAPRAVMNAGYTGVQTSINATDKGGHCSNWAQWPNN